MRKAFLTIVLLACGLCAMADDWPTTSTLDQPVWYYIQFNSNGAVVADKGEGAEVQTAMMDLQSDAQLWIVQGNQSEGWSFVNKLGRTLYVTATTTSNGFFRTSTSPTNNTRFDVMAKDDGNGFIIAPKGAATYMNMWEGAGIGRRIGLWGDRNDVNAVIRFVEAADFDPDNIVPLIPYPVSLERRDGTFDIRTLQLAADGSENRITVVDHSDLTEPSAYELSITTSGITIHHNDDAGLFYALQTLRQLQETSRTGVVPCMEIRDYPRFQHRGYMLDVARHFFNKEEVKQVLDIMAMYKLNVFHWHLTDDQGWRIEIPEYPRLTEVGAVRERSFTSFGLGTNFYDDTEYGRGCYFTLDDLREIVAYAAERHITIIPEVDMPGHMVAALASYPEFSCNPSKTYSVRIDSGISHDILDISNPEVIAFLKCVLGHVAEVFPGRLIHIGGDECPTENWANSASCQAFARERGLTIDQLQGWLVEELGIWLRDNYGKDIVVWDELLARWPSSNQIKPVVMAWTGIGKSGEAANRGMQSIIAPYQQMYLDFMQAAPADCDVNEGYFGGWSETNINTLDEIYNLNPTSSLGGREQYCLGPQCNMWAETCCDFSQVLYQLLPRGLALAEIGWTQQQNKNWPLFIARLQSHDEVFEAHGWPYGKHFFDYSDLSQEQTTLREARTLLADTHAGQAGYVSQEVYDALLAAADALEQCMDSDTETADALQALQTAITTYKRAPVCLPDPTKIYQIVSASSYYKAKYEGSTIYLTTDKTLRFHYTPQIEPEELWQFVDQGDGTFKIMSFLNLLNISMPGTGNTASVKETGTKLSIVRATTRNGNYDYVPGALLVQRGSTNSNMLYANVDGNVINQKDTKLCCQGTWRLVEVDDWSLLLGRLVDKCQLLIFKGLTTDEQTDYLTTKLINPALDEQTVTRSVYDYYVNVYATYLGITRKDLTPVEAVEAEASQLVNYYDLQGRPITHMAGARRTLVIGNDGTKRIM